MVKVIELEIEESLLDQVDEVSAQIGVSRTAFIMSTLQHALRRHHLAMLTAQDEAGYRLLPADDAEVEEWLEVQEWGDPWDGPNDNRLN